MVSDPSQHSIATKLREVYQDLYDARTEAEPFLAITPVGVAALKKIDGVLRVIHPLLQALTVFGPMIDDPEVKSLLLTGIAGGEVSERDLRAALGDEMFDVAKSQFPGLVPDSEES